MICATCESETVATPCTDCGNDALLVGKYRLERILGRGAQGTTFLATGPDGICAIKELHLGRAGAGKRAELIHREAAVLAQVKHPNIPTLHEHFVEGVGVARSLYLVQDYVQGETLEERLKTHRFTQAEVTDIVQQVGRILTALHGLSPAVIHRDIKPSNLIVDDDGQVHLIDFGSVRDVMQDSVGGGSTVAGTFGFMPPEQLVGDATPPSDIYALGMTAVRLLTRQSPITLTDHSGRLDWRSHANVSDATAAWLDRMVSRDPTKRGTATDVQIGPASTSPAQPQDREPSETSQSNEVASGSDIVLTLPGALSHYDVEQLADLACKHNLLQRKYRVRQTQTAPPTYEVFDANAVVLEGQESWMRVRLHANQSRVEVHPHIQAGYGFAFLAILLTLPLGIGLPLWATGHATITYQLLIVTAVLTVAGIAHLLGMSFVDNTLTKSRLTSIRAFREQAHQRWGVPAQDSQQRLPREQPNEDNTPTSPSHNRSDTYIEP